MEPVEISAGRLHLRPWQVGDERALQRLLDDPEIARWTPHPSPYLLEHARERIAGYKLPRSMELRTEPLPLSGAMKVLKRELREPHWAGHERRVH